MIPEAVSLHLLTRLIKSGVNKCFEPFCGVGGIAVHFAGSIEEYTVNDIDPAKVRMLRQNLKVYHKSEGNLNFHEQDFLSM